MNIRELCGNIRERKIMLYGTNDDVVSFLEKYHDRLNIQGVLVEHRDEYRIQPYRKWNLDAIMFENADIAKEHLIVICCPGKFGSLSKRLGYMGREEYKDFVSMELVDTLLYGKKLMVCMGTHLMQQISNVLESSVPFKQQYSVICYRECELLHPYMNRIIEYKHVGKYCDVYIRSACEKDKFMLKILDSELLNQECQVIKVADFGFGGYYPQLTNDRDCISRYLLRGHHRLPQSYEIWAMSRTDKEIVNLCKQGVEINAIQTKIMADNYFDSEYIETHFMHELERFKQLEEGLDITLSAYIESHKRKALCRNLNEWNEPLISYVIEKISERIALPDLELSKQQREDIIENCSGSEIFIYPCVKKVLGMEEDSDKKEYKVVTYYQERYMKLEEYVVYMITYLYKAIDLIQFSKMEEKEDEVRS